MSQAFVRESEEQWLHDVAPTVTALIIYLTRENNGVRVYEKSKYFSKTYDRDVYQMSNGFYYTKDNEGKWYIAE